MRLTYWLASASVLSLVACNGGDLVLPNEGVPARIDIVSGNTQTATVGAALPENLVVRVLDSRDRPVVDQQVDFAAAAGSGVVTPASPTTDADGRATAQWVLGPATGAQSATARPVGNGAPANLSASFTATATASRAARVAKFAGDGQTATAGTAVPIPPSVRVFDANDNPVAGVPVTFAVAAGGGTAVPTSPVSTNADGVAAATSWTLGAVAGPNSLTATVGGASVSGSPVTFSATGVVGSANRLVFSVQPVNAAVGAPITPPVEVQIQDAVGNVITNAGAQVTITLGNNPGAATLSGETTVNASQGTATFANLRLSAPGTGYTLRALASGLTDATSIAFDVVNGGSRTEIRDISPSSTVVGQQYRVEFRVTAAPPASGTPTGLVTVSDGTGATCQAQVAVESCFLTSTTRGTKQIVAIYTGDANFAGSASDPENHAVNAAQTSTTITAHTPDPSLFGQQVTVQFTVAVSGPGTGTPDGTVTVTYQNGGSCSAPVGAGQCVFVPANTGNDRDLTAQYTSSSGNFASSSDTDDHTVRAVNTTTTVGSSDASSNFGQPVSFTATVTPEAGGGQPAGTVQFRIDGSNFGAPVTLSGGSATSPSTSTLLPGEHEVRAVYNPGPGFADSEGTTQQTVGLAPTTTTAGTNPSSSVFGEQIAITATVSSGLGSVNAGGVTFYDGGNSCGSGAQLGSDQVSGGSASINVSSLSAGNHRIWACYGGSGGLFAPSGDDVFHEVSPAPTETSISGLGNSGVGEAVTVGATVTALAPGSGTPTGVVTVTADDGTNCSPPISLSTGSGSCTLTFTTAGAKQITATYQGDGNFSVSSATADHDVTSAL
ncbi:MAG: Ig-like domain repeat protein [Gemmatimonadales bacterium]